MLYVVGAVWIQLREASIKEICHLQINALQSFWSHVKSQLYLRLRTLKHKISFLSPRVAESVLFPLL